MNPLLATFLAGNRFQKWQPTWVKESEAGKYWEGRGIIIALYVKSHFLTRQTWHDIFEHILGRNHLFVKFVGEDFRWNSRCRDMPLENIILYWNDDHVLLFETHNEMHYAFILSQSAKQNL